MTEYKYPDYVKQENKQEYFNKSLCIANNNLIYKKEIKVVIYLCCIQCVDARG